MVREYPMHPDQLQDAGAVCRHPCGEVVGVQRLAPGLTQAVLLVNQADGCLVAELGVAGQHVHGAGALASPPGGHELVDLGRAEGGAWVEVGPTGGHGGRAG